MNRLKSEKQEMILNLLVEGNSIRSITRIANVDKGTVLRLLVSAGSKCQELLDSNLRGLVCEAIEADELHCIVRKRQVNLTPEERYIDETIGEQYVFVALDAKTKLIPSYIVGKRNSLTTLRFMQDLKERVTNRFQLSTDRFRPYFSAVDAVFGSEIDYATLEKVYYSEEEGRERYSPSKLQKVKVKKMIGHPSRKRICTSYVERQNLTIRMKMRRLTRLTNAFSKKFENLQAALAIHFFHYNFMRIHQTLRVTPAMEAGITNSIWKWSEVI